MAEVEKTLNNKRLKHSKRLRQNNDIIDIKQSGNLLFSINFSIVFTEGFIEHFEFQESKYFAEGVQKFIIKHLLATSGYEFTIGSGNIFALPLSKTLKPDEKNPEKLFESFVEANMHFSSFMEKIREINENYKKDPEAWIRKYMPKKEKSLVACWNLIGSGRFIEINKQKYFEIVGEFPSHSFITFTLIILSQDSKKVQMYSTWQDPQGGENIKSFSYSKEKNFKTIVEEITTHLFCNESSVSDSQEVHKMKNKSKKIGKIWNEERKMLGKFPVEADISTNFQ